jgi:hypothetical protein
MTGHTLVFVALGPDAKVIDLIDLANRNGCIAPGYVKGLGFPRPMRGPHHLSRGIPMTFQAGACHILARFEFTSDDIRMIDMHRLLGQVVSGFGRCSLGTRQKVEDRDENHNNDS